MDYYFLVSRLCLFAFLTLGCCAQKDVEVRWDMSEDIIYSHLGAENIQLNCALNQGPLYVTMNKLEIIHQNPVTKEERTMSLGALLQDDAKPEFYDIKIDTEASQANLFHIIFTIKSVRDQDDGPFICKATDSDTGNETRSEIIDLVVVKPVTEVELHFGDNPGITKRPAEALAIDGDSYPVKCVAKGANPAVKSVELFFDGVPVETNAMSTEEDKDSEYRTFVSSISGVVDLMVKDSGKDLQCVAKDTADNTVTSELGIEVNKYDPVIVCNETSAQEDEMNPILVCTVNHTDIVVESFAFQIGKTGDLIKVGMARDDKMEATTSEISEGLTEVTLDLHKAQNWHFDEDFYIVIQTKGGHATKERITLVKLEKDDDDDDFDGGDDGNSASMVDGRLVMSLSILMSLLVQLF